jgi:hypothetical protein
MDLEGNGRGLIEVIYQNEPGENDENQEKPQTSRCHGQNLKRAQPRKHVKNITLYNGRTWFTEFASCTYIYKIVSIYRNIARLEVPAVCTKRSILRDKRLSYT